jgi:hypothetical protein
MAYPRLCALAEVVWSSKEARDWQNFARRLPLELERLKILDVHFRPLTPLPAAIAHWNVGSVVSRGEPATRVLVGAEPAVPVPAAARTAFAASSEAQGASSAASTFSQLDFEVTSAIARPGTYTAAFVQTRGHIDIEWVELRADGALLARVTRPGSSDLRDRNNDYEFTVPEGPRATHYTLGVSLRSTGGALPVLGLPAAAGDIYLIPK